MQALRAWFLENKRDLPWRRDPTPYGVWISEVMLQQTQVAAVLPYYARWMRLFPTVEALAAADIADVIKAWEGLGYYSRARNLHLAARQIVEQYGGVFPSDLKTLLSLKGIGVYTAGAILNFAFHKRAPTMDGNVMRVLCRYFGIAENIEQSATRKTLEQHLLGLLPETQSWVVSEALIELGALVCRKQPLCEQCPLQKNCVAYAQGTQLQLPVKNKKTPVTKLTRTVFLVHCQEHLLVTKRPSGEVMGDLWEFPYVEADKTGQNTPEPSWTFCKHFPIFKHSFTRYQAILYPLLYEAKKLDSRFVPVTQVTRLPFSAGHRQLLYYYLDQHYAHFTY